ncbi:MAG: helix-turn-helix transcriptional regulator [Clostridia bacterium]|nr:helix-turn-helix transcriptional regulator [Clostridia bacterium]
MELKLSENIKSFRVGKGLTQRELADALAVSPQAISRWEQGQAYPDVLMLERLATFFGVTLDALVGRGIEYVEGLKRRWHALRQKESSLKNALEECDLLEKLALAGHEQVAYYRCLIQYKHRTDRPKGVLDDEQALERRIAGARALLKEHLKNCSADQKLRALFLIFCIDEEERLEEWQEFVSAEFEDINYSDLLLERYRFAEHDPEKFEKELQYNVYRKISALLYTLVNYRCVREEHREERRVSGTMYGELHPAGYYKTALDTLKVYSKKDYDLFLPQRALILTQYAAALLRDGQEEEGFKVLFQLQSTMKRAAECFLKGEKLRGSVPVLAGVVENEEETHYFFGRMMDTVAHEQGLPEYAPFRDDPRFTVLSELWEEIKWQVCIASLKKNGADFEMLLEGAKDELKKRSAAKNEQAIVMKCKDGTVRRYFYDPHDEKNEQKMLTLLERERPLIEKMVVLWGSGGVDVPSYAFRQKLVDIHPENGGAQLLLQGYYKYDVKTVAVTMPNKSQ